MPFPDELARGLAVVAYDRPWPGDFAVLAERIHGALGSVGLRAVPTGSGVPSSRNFAVGLLCEMVGYEMPVVVVPHCKPQLASHPAFAASLETLLGIAGHGRARALRSRRAV